MGDFFYKEPTEKLDYFFEWTLGDAEGISSQTWVADPSGLTLSTQTITAPQTSVRIDGGVSGTDYVLTNTITTTTGRKDVQIVTVRVQTELISTATILQSIPGGDDFDPLEAREIVEGAIARVAAAYGGTFPNDAFSRMVARRLARAEIWGDVLRQSGYLASDEATKEEDRAEKILKEFDAHKVLPSETHGGMITTRSIQRG